MGFFDSTIFMGLGHTAGKLGKNIIGSLAQIVKQSEIFIENNIKPLEDVDRLLTGGIGKALLTPILPALRSADTLFNLVNNPLQSLDSAINNNLGFGKTISNVGSSLGKTLLNIN
jgi:hypothetical protein